tara:strand:- start:19 stop:1032 length:1014 start_codon:yes stop_codon:yes gene_type:complete
MANILVGSPRFESITLSTGYKSAVLTLKIDNVLRYTIIKSGVGGQTITFEISELIRDYLNITFSGTYTEQTVSTQGSTIKEYLNADGTGPTSPYTIVNVDHVAYDGYGTFMEGVNPNLGSGSQWLIQKDVIKNGYYIYVPEESTGVVPYLYSDQVFYGAYQTNDTTLSSDVPSFVVNIVRINCSRYSRESPSNLKVNKITFVNKFGVLQDLWFFLKTVKTTTSTKETFNANTISTSTGSATYSVNSPTKKVFNKSANQKIVLSSGFYPEGANPFFEELLLSKQIWLTQPKPSSPADAEIVPVIISTSSFTYKTSLNDKLIEYTMEFDMAFDYINNVR